MAAVRPAGPEPTMTSFESTRPSPLSTVDGPPGAGTAVASAGSSTIVIENPPNGLEASVIGLCYTRYRDTPRGYRRARVGRHRRPADAEHDTSTDRVECRDDVASQRLHIGRFVRVLELEDDVLGAAVPELAEPVDDLLRRLRPCRARRPEPDVLQCRALDLARVTSDLGAMLVQDRVLAGDTLRGAEHVARVGVLGDEAESLLLAATADHDRRSRPRDRLGR